MLRPMRPRASLAWPSVDGDQIGLQRLFADRRRFRSFKLLCWLIATFVAASFACSEKDPDEETPFDDGIVKPKLTPCPAGWAEVPAAPPDFVATCEPWPEGGVAPAALPILTPCPAGWREVAAKDYQDAAGCSPWPLGGPDSCDAGQAHFPGEPTCSAIGVPCPSGRWPTGLPAVSSVLYVDASASSGGNGSTAAPFSRISDALRAAQPGSIVALAAGVYEGAIEIPRGVTIWGKCSAQTTITSAFSIGAQGTVMSFSADTTLRNVLVTGPRPGVFVGQNGHLVIDGVLIEEATGVALMVGLGEVKGQSVVLRRTRSRPDGTGGHAALALHGASLELRRAVLDENRDVALAALDTGTTVSLEDTLVRQTLGRTLDNGFGTGVVVGEGAQGTVERLVISGNRNTGLLVAAGSELTASRVIISDTQSDGRTREHGVGLWLTDGASATITKSELTRNRAVGVLVSRGSDVELEDVIVRDTVLQESTPAATGLAVGSGASASVRRTLFAGNGAIGVLAMNQGSRLSLFEVVVRDTGSFDLPLQEGDSEGGIIVSGASAEIERTLLIRNESLGFAAMDEASVTITDMAVREGQPRRHDGRFGRGLYLKGSNVLGSRLLLAGNREGALVAQNQAFVSLKDVVIRDTESQEHDLAFGRGLTVEYGTVMELTRVLVERVREVGISVHDPSTVLSLSDAVIRDVNSQVIDGTYGSGMVAQGGATISLERGLVTRSRGLGIAAFEDGEPGTNIRLENVAVRDTLEIECALTTCKEYGAGIGLGVYGAAAITAEGFAVERSRLAGVQVARGGEIDLTDGWVRDNPVGVNVQTEGFDTRRVTNNVRFVDNDVNLDSREMRIPDPMASLAR